MTSLRINRDLEVQENRLTHEKWSTRTVAVNIESVNNPIRITLGTSSSVVIDQPHNCSKRLDQSISQNSERGL
jgi:hypothetical protein